MQTTCEQLAKESIEPEALRLDSDDSRPYTYLECQTDLSAVIQTIKNRRPGYEVRLVWLLDEVDMLLGTNQWLQVKLRTMGQSPSTSPHLRFVLAGIQPLRDLEEYGSPFYNTITQVALGPLSEEDAKKLIVRPVHGRYAYGDDAIEMIISACNSEPFWIQQLCREVVLSAAEQERALITTQDVQAAIQRMPDGFPCSS